MAKSEPLDLNLNVSELRAKLLEKMYEHLRPVLKDLADLEDFDRMLHSRLLRQARTSPAPAEAPGPKRKYVRQLSGVRGSTANQPPLPVWIKLVLQKHHALSVPEMAVQIEREGLKFRSKNATSSIWPVITKMRKDGIVVSTRAPGEKTIFSLKKPLALNPHPDEKKQPTLEATLVNETSDEKATRATHILRCLDTLGAADSVTIAREMMKDGIKLSGKHAPSVIVGWTLSTLQARKLVVGKRIPGHRTIIWERSNASSQRKKTR